MRTPPDNRASNTITRAYPLAKLQRKMNELAFYLFIIFKT